MTDSKCYDDEDLLALSGIQHFAFCERQWALIHIEKQWEENVLTVEGKQMHERVDDPYFSETRNNVRIVRSVPLVSRSLGLYGVADAIEYWQDTGDISSMKISIVEYKRGKPKADDRDEVQLCAQGMCIEEMLGVKIDSAYLFYGETRHRNRVQLDEELRTRVRELTARMHDLYEKGITPTVTKQSKCRNCSLGNICVPELGKKRNVADRYLKQLVEEAQKEAGE